MKVVKKQDGYYIVDENGKVIKGPFVSMSEATQAMG